MGKKYIILSYLLLFYVVIVIFPSKSFSYSDSNEPIVQYIIHLSKDILRSIDIPAHPVLDSSKGEVKMKLLLSPWGELKDAYVSESSGSREIDSICLNAVLAYDRYQPFPEELGEEDVWIDVPIIFRAEEPKELIASSKLVSSTPGVSGRTRRVSEGVSEVAAYDVSGLDEAVDIALENRLGTQIARQEIELSKLKEREARRALYPTASLNFLETIGRTTTDVQDFTDKEYKIKFEHPLYYGWRLKYAVEQASTNIKASKYSYDKVVQDLRGEVEDAYYNYLTNKETFELQEILLKEAEKIFDIAKKRFDSELTTRAEFLDVESKFKQIEYQKVSAENELDMAMLTLAQAMNVDDADELGIFTDVDLAFEDWQPIDIDVSLKECMDLAFRSRPDIRSKEYMLEFSDYERKIAQSKNQFKVDLTGSYGKSGGAFETESLTLGKDWFVGFKVSKPLGGSTLSTSYTKEETSEKHGQSTRTEAITKSTELGLLDNLQSFSEKKSSEIALSKAREELEKTKAAVLKEVKESYLNYKKGLIQIESNLNKIKHKEQELKVAQAQSELNEIPFSTLLGAHIQLIDEKTFYIESVGSLLQSLAKLNRATGYTLLSYEGNVMLANL